MRDVIIVLVFAGVLGWSVWKKSPFTAIMVYFWISFMNPHRFTWGFAYSLPLAMGSAAVTFMVIILGFKNIKWPKSYTFYLFLLLWLFVTITTITSIYPDDAWAQWNIINKIFLMTTLAMLIVNTKQRLLIFMLGIVFFIGLVGIKGAIFGVATGGQYTVWGPPETFLEDNNDLGLALIIILPLSFYIKDLFKKKWVKIASLGMTFSIMMSAALTYSRGALLGLIAVAFFIVIRSKHKIAIGFVTVCIIAVGINFLPDSWFDRMNSIKSYEEDRSAQMRINSWLTAINLAKAKPFGGGFDCFTIEMYELYSPNPELGKRLSGGASTAHSIYFEVLAYHGFGGLFLYLLSIGLLYLSLGKLVRTFKKIPELEWISIMSRACMISIIGFLVSGAFLSRGFFDLFWAVYAFGACLLSYVNSGGWLSEFQNEENDVNEAVQPG
jgi:putative inorganic carbon (hco3(-)) transporter